MGNEASFLEKIVASTRVRVAQAKARGPAPTPASERAPFAAPAPARLAARGLYESLSVSGLSFIAEVKRASPSKGLIASDFPYLEIARDYQAAGAAAISVLTEPEFFLGSGEYLAHIAAEVELPVLCKDFIIDAFQVREAAALGAAAGLLIVALLSDDKLFALRELAQTLGMDALVETHDERELRRALASGARVIGVNNRDLKTFEADLAVAERLRPLVPSDVLFVAESGIHTSADVARMVAAGADAVLVGESLMRSPDRRAALAELRRAARAEAARAGAARVEAARTAKAAPATPAPTQAQAATAPARAEAP
jgi:indole-3-glycerol phosphate synthase